MMVDYADLAAKLVEKAGQYDYDTAKQSAILGCAGQLAIADALGKCAGALRDLNSNFRYAIDSANAAEKAGPGG